MIEREIKLIVSETELLQYKKILDARIAATKTLQINSYFDTPDSQLNFLGSTLRIRQKDGWLTLQYKYDKQYIDIERACKELEMGVRDFLKYILSKNLPCSALNPSLSYDYVGNLITKRFDYVYDGVVISMDKSYYFGKYDPELEIEFQDRERAEDALISLPIEKAKFHQEGKYDRFVKDLQKLRWRFSN